jgi:5-methylcytosine-specific restriction endonuclease McrA
MSELSWAAIRKLVYERANGCCEYCQTSEKNTGQTMQVEHIIPDGPRQQVWHEHFEWLDEAIRLKGLSPIGRATIVRLKMNHERILTARARWVIGGFHPPK